MEILDLIERVKSRGDAVDDFYAEAAEREYRHLMAVVRSLELALDFYAREYNWEWRGGYCPAADDCGQKARRALDLVAERCPIHNRTLIDGYCPSPSCPHAGGRG